MTSNVALKRIVAYLIDYLVITLISSALVYLTFINPRYDEYVETSNTYNEVLQNYYSGEIDANELSEQTRELSYELNSNGYVYTIGNIIIIFLYFGVFAYLQLCGRRDDGDGREGRILVRRRKNFLGKLRRCLGRGRRERRHQHFL